MAKLPFGPKAKRTVTRVVSTFPSTLPVSRWGFLQAMLLATWGGARAPLPPGGGFMELRSKPRPPGRCGAQPQPLGTRLGPWLNQEPQRWTPLPGVGDRAGFALLGEINKQG